VTVGVDFLDPIFHEGSWCGDESTNATKSQFQQDILPVTAPSEKICKEPANAPEKTYSQVLAVPDKNNTATAAKLAGWDHADDLEDILNDDVDNFFA
jgi:hypothetical protein